MGRSREAHAPHVVGTDEASGDDVSVLSPLGRALIGAKTGDEIEIERPRGATRVTILEVS